MNTTNRLSFDLRMTNLDYYHQNSKRTPLTMRSSLNNYSKEISFYTPSSRRRLTNIDFSYNPNESLDFQRKSNELSYMIKAKHTENYKESPRNSINMFIANATKKIIPITTLSTFPSKRKKNDFSIKIPSNRQFDSMSEALRTLTVNNEVASQMSHMKKDYQIESYITTMNNLSNQEKKIAKMPQIKIKKSQPIDKMKFIMRQKKKSVILLPYIKISRESLMNNNIILNPIDLPDVKIGICPTSRSKFTMNLYDTDCFVFGGINSAYSNEMWMFRFMTHDWIRLQSKDDPYVRCNHSAAIIENQLIIYGGSYPLNHVTVPEDLVIFNLDTYTYTYPNTFRKKGPGSRKGHIGVSVGQSMLIHGGLDDRDVVTNSAWVMSMPRYTWSELPVKGLALPYLIYHSACVVSDYDKKTFEGEKYTIFRPPSDTKNKAFHSFIKIKGVYMFGGMKPNGDLNEELYVITICKSVCDVLTVKTQGKGPLPRINGHMIYINQLNLMIIHGGENKTDILNDFFILDLETLDWKKPLNDHTALSPRTEHKLMYFEGKILVLGGRDDCLYHKMNFLHVDLHPEEKD